MKILKKLAFSVFFLASQICRSQNYDEAKVPAFTLPDPLLTTGHKKVTLVKDWEKYRRPEVLKLFEDNVYGTMPKKFDHISYRIIRQDDKAMNGAAKLKEVGIAVTNQGRTVQIILVMFTPNKVLRPAPVFLLINNRSKNNTDPDRKIRSEFWPAEMLVDSGYAIAAFHYADLAPDDKDKFKDALLTLYPDELQRDNGMRAVGAWAFGASRVLDYLENDKDVDARKVAVVGHSRGGKAALWAAAQDKRFAMCFTNCSGNTGAALARRQFGERIAKINETFPHWFTTNYKKYNNKEDLLPVDQHMLIALIAPRPVYATNATQDLWADPKGTYLAMKAAEPVFDLYRRRSSLPAMPPIADSAVTTPPLGYHNRTGIHNMTIFDWANFIKFAKAHYDQ